MASQTPNSLIILLLLAFSLISISSAHNITHLLSNYPDFSSFNSLLSSTDLAVEINSRRTITVLAVSNASIGAFSGYHPEMQRIILSVHVILDYFDLEKLHNLKKRSAILTTLFQTSGIADGRTGFLNVTNFADGRTAFGSAEPGADLVADLVGSVASRPYNISVLQVSSFIFPPGMDNFDQNTTVSLPPPPPTLAVPSKAPVFDAGAPASNAEAPIHVADAPVHVADAPVVNMPEAESPVQDEDEEANSGGERVAVGSILGVIMAAILTAWL